MKKLLLVFVLVFTTLFTSVLAEYNPRAVIIFDASGSMWGQINGVTKIEIARDALKNVVREWNPSVELGLTVYGHRSKGDCNDIETIIPVGKIDKNRVIKTVMGIKPKGKTPISRSLRKVAEEIKYTEEKATIILISDGKETCDPDPCGTAKELEKQGIDFVTHVIGFNVDKKTDKQLECIASATGGEYFSAKNAAALNKAMKVIAKKVEKVEPAPAPKPVAKKLEHTVEISNSEKEDGKWVVAYNSIYEDEDGKAGDRAATAHSRKKSVGKAQIPVGKYIIKSTYNDFEVFTPIEVKPGKVTKIHVVMGQTGMVEISNSEKEDGKWVVAYNSIYEDEDGKAGDRAATAHSRKKSVGKAQIPVGKYIIKSTYNDFEVFTPIEVKPGEVTKIHVVMGQTGTVEVTASEKEGGKWIAAYHNIVQNEDGKVGDLVARANSSKKSAGTRQIPVGKYIIESSYNNFKKETLLEVKAGETTKVHVTFGQFLIKAKCSDMNVKISYEIYASSGQLVNEKQIKCSDTLKVILDSGDYSVEVKVDNDTKEVKFTVGGDQSKLLIDMTDIKKEPTKEELIKADSAELEVTSSPKQEEQKSEKITIGDKQIEIKGMSQEDAKKLNELGAMLGALGGMMQGANPEAQKKQEEKQNADNAKADKEFDDMSKELDMFTK
ncbi:vWA domain-containing protein [Sulfurovum sp. CS9]|uniref:vWA domain-containing protein n=1 Tax=Sulfurovum sp. CS9 TaxID=3391146 RepID=UPI0039E9DEEC